VLPIVAAQRADLVRSDHTLDEYVRLLPTPGHTIDHFSVELGLDRTEAILTGDALHSPLQARYPDLSMRLDLDQSLSRQSRRALLQRCCDAHALCAFAHFPSPSMAKLKPWGNGFRCEYVS
jgi:glyoxylase-like metal-dependent hydrolase (beta-lactamase superfamily II)